MDEQLFEYSRELLERLIVFMSNNGSMLWIIAVKQAQVSGMQCVFVGCIALIVTIILMIFSYRYRDDPDDLDAFFALLSAIPFSCFVVLVSTGMGRLLNPEWYAVKILLEQFR